jgi:sulfite reductase (NADPH) hemoprotein beta-component
MSHHSVEDIKIRTAAPARHACSKAWPTRSPARCRESDQRLIKFHGSYQQDDRDLRDERRRQKLEPAHQFMIRIRARRAACSRPAQWLKLDAIATHLRQPLAARHHAPDLPVPRRDQARTEGDDAGDQRRR